MQGVEGNAAFDVESRKLLFSGFFVVLSIPVLWGVRKGIAPARAALALYLLFLLFVTLLYPWYLIPAIAVIGITATRLELGYMAMATTLGLLYYPFYVWAHFASGLSLFHRHLFLSLFLTVPLVVYLVLWYGDLGKCVFWRGRRQWRPEQLVTVQNTV